MGIISKVSAAVQALFGEMAEEVSKAHPVVLRKRKFTTATLAQTFVLGFLAKSRASDEELAQTAALCGVDISPQAIEQRFTHRLASFLEALFRRATQHIVAAQSSLAPLLERFPAVFVLDSSTITLPDDLSERFPGCGGGHGGGAAAMKLQVQWNLRDGAVDTIAIESGRNCDYKTPLQSAELPRGSLRITDLGYFDTEVFERFDELGVFWLSRLLFGTSVFSLGGERLPLLEWLGNQPGPFVDQRILLGTVRKVSCRLIAWRVPEEVANRRRQKLIAETRRKDGRVPSHERLEWCNWTILVTNVPEDLLTPKEAAVLYRSRWQIELLFKRWKSLGLVADLAGSTTARQMVRLWARLIAVLVQHWLLLCTTWNDPGCSLAKACKAISRHAVLLIAAIGDPATLEAVIRRLGDIITRTARKNKRKKPSTTDLLRDPSCLEYSLT
jgi:hypothetical protein